MYSKHASIYGNTSLTSSSGTYVSVPIASYWVEFGRLKVGSMVVLFSCHTAMYRYDRDRGISRIANMCGMG